MARRGAGQVRRRSDEPTEPDRGKRPTATGRVGPRSPARASEAWQAAAPRPDSQSPAWEPERWVQDDDVRQEANRAVKRAERTIPARRTPPRSQQRKAPVAAGLLEDFPTPAGRATAPKLAQRLAEAGRAFERERYPEARKLLRPLLDQTPRSAAVRELYGLTLYRLGKWREAIRELEAFRTLTASTEQHPVLADCYRALGRWTEAEQLWDELRAASPSAELVAEGRIVAAGALADQGKVSDAIQLLERGLGAPRRPKEHHLRLRYALADLYERAGDVPRARELFGKVAATDADFADAAERLRSLG
ncbi:MAG: tetratricopeptide repeat protein [Acidimicrobiales bacterium]